MGAPGSLKNCINIADLRALARRKLPRPIFDDMDGDAEDEATQRRNRRIMTPGDPKHARWALAILTATLTLNMFDRQIINVLAQQIKVDLKLSDTELGLLTGTAFGIFYALMGMPLGRLADKVNRVRLIGVCVVLWSAFTAVCGFTRNFTELLLARVAVGVGEAGAQPASAALIPDLFSEKRRGVAMSILLLAMPGGSFLGLFFGGLAGQAWGWRIAFTLAGLPGLILALLLFTTVRDPRSGSARSEPASDAPSTLSVLAMLIRRPGYLAMVIGNMASTFLVYAGGAWLPLFFIRVHHMSTAEIGSFAAVAVGVGGGIGILGGGVIADLIRRWVKESETVVLVAITLLSLPLLLGAVFSPERDTALACMVAFDVFAFAFLPPMVRATQRAATPQTRALAIGVTSSAATVSSLGIGFPIVGALSDALTPAYGAYAVGYALAIAASVGLVGVIAYARAGTALRSAPAED